MVTASKLAASAKVAEVTVRVCAVLQLVVENISGSPPPLNDSGLASGKAAGVTVTSPSGCAPRDTP